MTFRQVYDCLPKGVKDMTTKKPINNVTQLDVDFAVAEGTFKAYQRAATKTAIYPGQGTPLGLAYCALKLNGEAGELAEHVGKAMRDDGLVPVGEGTLSLMAHLDGKLTSARMALVVKEVGDVLWYLSAICNEIGCTLEDAAAINLRKLKDRSDRDALQGSGDER